MNINASETAELLRQVTQPIMVITHASPDGDTTGSGYALSQVLAQLGKTVTCVCSDVFPARFTLLEELRAALGNRFAVDYGAGAAVRGETDRRAVNRDFVPDTAGKFIVSVDVADMKLAGAYKDVKVHLAIDHHISNVGYADKLLYGNCAAAAEVVYSVAEVFAQSGEVEIDDLIKMAVYVGVATDTGCFRYANTTANSHLVAAAVMEGRDFGELNYTLFEMKTRGQAEMTKYALSQMQFLFDGRCAIIALDNAILCDADIDSDTENISPLTRQAEGVEVGVLMKEKKIGEWKISVRTSYGVSAADICALLNGGGHTQAAGGIVRGTYEVVYNKVIAAVGAVLPQNSGGS